MAKKYDTNPLDPEFSREAAREIETEALPYSGAKTNPFPYAAPTEEQTRRFAEADFNAYSASPFNGQNVPQNYAPNAFADMNRASSRNVPKVGMPEKWLVGLPYIPWFIGLVASIIILLVVPRSETKVRFHAAQGLAAHIGILIVSALLGGLGNVAGMAKAGNVIFQIVTTIMLILFAVKAWRGKPVHIESVDDLTNWLDEKIKPRA
jgi:uncharacterized membrane protein